MVSGTMHGVLQLCTTAFSNLAKVQTLASKAPRYKVLIQRFPRAQKEHSTNEIGEKLIFSVIRLSCRQTRLGQRYKEKLTM